MRRLGECCCCAEAVPVPPAQSTQSRWCSAAVPVPLHGCNKQQFSVTSCSSPVTLGLATQEWVTQQQFGMLGCGLRSTCHSNSLASPPWFPTAGQAQMPAQGRTKQIFLALPGKRWGQRPTKLPGALRFDPPCRHCTSTAQSRSWPPASSNTVPAVGKHVGRTEAEVSARQAGMQFERNFAAGGPPAGAAAAAGDAAAVAAAMPATGRQMGPGLRRETATAPAQACRWAVEGVPGEFKNQGAAALRSCRANFLGLQVGS